MKIVSILRSLVLLLVVSLFVGCSAAQNAVTGYEDMKAAIVQVSKSASNFQLVTDTSYTKIQTKNQILGAAMDNNEATVAAWKGVETAAVDTKAGYSAAQTKTAGVLDIGALQDKGLLPSTAIPAFASSINAYSSSIVDIRLDPTITLSVMDTVDEAMNSIQAAGADWNEAVAKYNTIRSKVGSEVIAKIVNDLGLSSLPSQLTGYVGASAGQPITNPIAPK